MKTISRTTFTTVKTEGGILPADLLQRIAEGRDLDGLRPEEDYHLFPGERLNEAINRAWNRCLGAWRAFDAQRARLPESDRGTTLTRERWLLILFQELGYGRLPFAGSLPLQAGDPDSPAYPISHRWEHAPIHLTTFRQDLDRRGTAPQSPISNLQSPIKRSPHSLMQEFLNRSDDHLWGFVSNGLRLRVLRDNVSLTRAAYVEFDLEAMMTGEQYADFALLWLVCHQSRVEGPTPEQCWLERWSKTAAEQGVRALDALRGGVQEAIVALGRGFLAQGAAHRANAELRERLQAGTLSGQDYYRQLLRLVYRLIFLFVAEDRDLLLTPDPSGFPKPEGSLLYNQYYSLHHLRTMAETLRGGPHADLYRSLRLLFGLLREGYPPLGLPALGSFLFSEKSTPDLDGAELDNGSLLEAIRALAFTIERNVRRPVDYRNLGAEELGSVYESLLELHPQINAGAAAFDLHTAAGSERKTTGSYYTPSSLIHCLLDSALEPVIEDRLAAARNAKHVTRDTLEKALLSIQVIDPACGSGHFLIAAAHRLARHLARARTGDEEPAPAQLRAALRDVVRHSIHGVDINPMAVELCKVALWMETLDPGKPLSFLDRNIQCGNSLVGVGPGMDISEIPDDAFKPVTGDDKATATTLRRRNKRERTGQLGFRWEVTEIETLDDLARWRAKQVARLDAMPEDKVRQLHEKEVAYITYLESDEYRKGRLEYDLWTAAFFWPIPKDDADAMLAPTQQELGTLRDGQTPDAELVRRVRKLADRRQFFHWELAFPDVFSGDDPGFDAVLGNPPWEKINLKDEEFFAQSYPEIAGAPTKAKRKKLILALRETDPVTYYLYQQERAFHDQLSVFFRYSGSFPFTGVSRVNLYSVFAELATRLLSSAGRTGLVIASGIATDDNNKLLFESLVRDKRLISVWDFENREGIFPGVHRMYKFCLFCAGGEGVQHESADFAFYLTNVQQIGETERHFTLSLAELFAVNPDSRTCPTFRNRHEAKLTKAIYRKVRAWCLHEETDTWPGNPKTPFNMSNDSHLFADQSDLAEREAVFDRLGCAKVGEEVFLPLYESKLIHQFNHRYATFIDGSVREMSSGELSDPWNCIAPRYWLNAKIQAERFPGNWFLAYRMITNATNERTAITTIVPQRPCGHSLTLIENLNPISAVLLCSTMNSFAYDYVARQKTAGTNLSHWIWKQLSILSLAQARQAGAWFGEPDSTNWLLQRVLELTYTAWDLQPFAQDCGYDGPPFRWDEGRRFLLCCELDAAYFHLYAIARDDVDYIMETFPIVKRKDEAAHGEYRTRRVILEIYDAMQRAIEAGEPYQTLFDPPPADPRVAHPPRDAVE